MKTINPTTIALFFQAHQPFRIKEYDFFHIGKEPDYFDNAKNLEILNRVCDRSYVPAIALFEKLHQESKGQFSFGLGISGTLLTQLEQSRPDVLEKFQSLVSRGIAHLVGGTYTHSLATLFSTQEQGRQIQQHKKILYRLFGRRPQVFANTELIYRDDMVQMIDSLGYKTILAEGVSDYLGHRAPDYMYTPPSNEKINLLLRNEGLSDDVGFRFANTSWEQYPLTAEKYLSWIQGSDAPVRNIFLDLETIGEHQGVETGIFAFWESFISQAISAGHKVVSPEKAVETLQSVDVYSSPKHSSWADGEKDKSAWLANVMQQESSQKLFRMQQTINAANDAGLEQSWNRLQSADHFMYMSTKAGSAGEVHQRFSPHGDPYDAYSYFMNVLADLQIRSKMKMAQETIKQTQHIVL